MEVLEPTPVVSEQDNRIFRLLRENVERFLELASVSHDREGLMLLDIAPQDHLGAAQFFSQANIFTADINPQAGADYTIDICANNQRTIADASFDVIVCTEVLEHTLQPFDAVAEIHRLLKPGGVLVLSTPFNFRIHGPLPDCWRFTEHGLRALLKDYSKTEISALEDEDRFLMPLHYTTLAWK